ncbi:hypothetical protein Pdsh_04785 [Pyrodictium delaneyi]|nr:hypothetical protein Pdsh_04785 [Pyrodictium delaneyi]
MHRLGGVMVPQRGLSQLIDSADPTTRDKFIAEIQSLAASIAVSVKLRNMDNVTPKDIIYLFIPNASIDEIDDDYNGKIVITLAEPVSENMIELLKAISTKILEAWGLRVNNVESYSSILVVEYTKPTKEQGKKH